MKILRFIALITLAFIVTQCAKQTSPTGGPKDEEPPILIKSTPPNQKTNFSGNKIELDFNEPVQINNAREQLVLTPNVGVIGKDVEIIAKKNKVILTINSMLEPNTTYSINFREAIADLNEKNTSPLKLAVSTGDYIDSLNFNGTVKDIFTSKFLNNHTVAAVPESDTFDIYKHQAVFFSFTDKEGNFSIENLKEGKYILYAFNDKNKNLKVDSRNEPYGFINKSVIPTTTNEPIEINTYKLDNGPFKLISAREMFGLFTIKTSKSIVDYKLESINSKEPIYHQQDTDLTSIKAYNTFPTIDSILVKFTAIDSAENKIDSLIYIKFSKKLSNTSDKFQVTSFTNDYIKETKTLTTTILFSKPVIHFKLDSLHINLDSITTLRFTENDIKWNAPRNHLTIIKTLPSLESSSKPKRIKKENTEQQQLKIYNKLILPKSSVISIQSDTLKQSELDIKIIKPEDVGIISYKVESKENFIIQLIDKSNKVVSETRNLETNKFDNLQPGVYYLRCIIDKNNNGKWDPGNLKTGTEAEKIIFYKNSKDQLDINIKANWEVGPLLITIE